MNLARLLYRPRPPIDLEQILLVGMRLALENYDTGR